MSRPAERTLQEPWRDSHRLKAQTCLAELSKFSGRPGPLYILINTFHLVETVGYRTAVACDGMRFWSTTQWSGLTPRITLLPLRQEAPRPCTLVGGRRPGDEQAPGDVASGRTLGNRHTTVVHNPAPWSMRESLSTHSQFTSQPPQDAQITDFPIHTGNMRSNSLLVTVMTMAAATAAAPAAGPSTLQIGKPAGGVTAFEPVITANVADGPGDWCIKFHIC
ncbi:hypothetical protein BKA62DRAFT_673517 [Auriculariales sp. MPI-PUGE-AT-0066]|nr:hypothetical protein BKA62DRAFT_673517 [Auriculariales sp. MPI-PUGE-AT-0066]